MYCNKCGVKIGDTYNFCKNCGNPISNNNFNKNITDDDLLKIYIGNNYEQLKKSKFSIPTFFLGIYYMLYRKMWLYALFSFIILIASLIITVIYKQPLYILIQILYSIIISFKFNELYIKSVEKKLEIIKQNNPQKTNKELALICKNKGGISILVVIISIIASITIIFIVIYSLLFYVFFSTIPNEIDNYNKNDNNTNNKLEYKVPDIFQESKTGYINYNNYIYNSEEAVCTISINNYINQYNTIEEYIKSDITINLNDAVSEIKTNNINNYNWKYIEIKNDDSTEYYYLSIFDNRIYKVKYKINKDDNKLCSDGYNTFINSLKFKIDKIDNDNIV